MSDQAQPPFGAQPHQPEPAPQAPGYPSEQAPAQPYPPQGQPYPPQGQPYPPQPYAPQPYAPQGHLVAGQQPYPPQPYPPQGQPYAPGQPYGAPAAGTTTVHPLAIVSLVLSGVGLLGNLFVPIFPFALCVGGWITGQISLSATRKEPERYGSTAVPRTAQIVGIVSTVLGILALVAVIALVGVFLFAFGSTGREVWDTLVEENAGTVGA